MNPRRVVAPRSKQRGFLMLPAVHRPSAGGAGTNQLLLHMDGSNGGTTFTDSGVNGFTPTVTGAITSTAQAKFGPSAGYFNGASRLTFAHDAAFDVVSLAWEADCWVHAASASGARSILSKRSGNDGWSLAIYNDNILAYRSGFGNISSTSPITANAWTHLRWSHDGTKMFMFVGGVIANPGGTTVPWSNNAHPLYVGTSVPGLEALTGYLDEVVIKTGTCTTSNFTPPTSPYA